MDRTLEEIEQLMQQASLGDAEAQCELGEYFEAKDNEQAVYWYSMAAKQKHLGAMYSLAYMYEYGLGVPANDAKALELYFLCSEQQLTDDPELAFCACKDIAVHYEEGRVVQQNMELAIEWYELAAEGGVMTPEDCQHVGQLYESGQGLERNYEQAAMWYLMAEDYGKLASIYRGPLSDDAKAQFYASRYASLKYPNMGTFLHGRQVKLNYNQIISNFCNYYENQYSSDLQYFFSMKFDEESQVLLAYSGNLSREMAQPVFDKIGDSIYFFSLAIYFETLFPQVICKFLGLEIMNDLHRCTGWPHTVCGELTFVNPIQLIRESMLIPSDDERDDYLFVFSQLRSYLINNFLDFLEGGKTNLHPESYERVVNAASSYLWEIEEECNVQVEIFRMWLNDHSLSYSDTL